MFIEPLDTKTILLCINNIKEMLIFIDYDEDESIGGAIDEVFKNLSEISDIIIEYNKSITETVE